jgi:SAM-dependent methyltransferase
MDEHATGQLTATAADYYEAFFVPALFRSRTGPLLELAGISSGDTVLDVGCGTGILARDCWRRMGSRGSVSGIDCNEGMIATASKVAPEIEWHIGQAEALPFDNSAFDFVISQFALMFFEDRSKALQEMWRVTRPGGKLVVAVWDKLENTPGYAAMTALDERLFGREVAEQLIAPYSMGDRALLETLFRQSGIPDIDIVTHNGMAEFPSIKAWVDLDVNGWTLGEMIGPEGHALLVETAERELQDFVQPDGRVAFPAPSHMVVAERP